MHLTILEIRRYDLLSKIPGEIEGCDRDDRDELYPTRDNHRVVRKRSLAALQRMASLSKCAKIRAGIGVSRQCYILTNRALRPLMGAGYLGPLEYRRNNLRCVAMNYQVHLVRGLNKHARLQELQWRNEHLRLPYSRRELVQKHGVSVTEGQRPVGARFKQLRGVAWDVGRGRSAHRDVVSSSGKVKSPDRYPISRWHRPQEAGRCDK